MSAKAAGEQDGKSGDQDTEAARLEGEKTRAEIARIRAEVLKIEVEHARMRSTFWNSIEIGKGTIPLVFAGITTFAAIFGYFDLKDTQSKLDAANGKLREANDAVATVRKELGIAQVELDNLNHQRKSLDDAIRQKRSENEELEIQRIQKNDEFNRIQRKLVEVQQKLIEAQQRISSAPSASGVAAADIIKGAETELKSLSAEPVKSAGSSSTQKADEKFEAAVNLLYSNSAPERGKGYDRLIPRYARDPDLIGYLMEKSVEFKSSGDPKLSYENGVYNSLVVVSHMDLDVLRANAARAKAFANSVRDVGQKTEARADLVIQRAEGR